MQFNPDPLKQAVQVIFSVKKVKPNHPPIYFNGKEVVTESKTEQKHLGFVPDKQLNFIAHLRPLKRSYWKSQKGHRSNKVYVQICH